MWVGEKVGETATTTSHFFECPTSRKVFNYGSKQGRPPGPQDRTGRGPLSFRPQLSFQGQKIGLADRLDILSVGRVIRFLLLLLFLFLLVVFFFFGCSQIYPLTRRSTRPAAISGFARITIAAREGLDGLSSRARPLPEHSPLNENKRGLRVGRCCDAPFR